MSPYRSKWIVGLIILAVAAYGCSRIGALGNNRTSEDKVYTLNRSSVVLKGEVERIHIATFDDSDVAEKYNRENCVIARDLFLNQPGVKVNY